MHIWEEKKRKVSASRRPPGADGHRVAELTGWPRQPRCRTCLSQRCPDTLVLGF